MVYTSPDTGAFRTMRYRRVLLVTWLCYAAYSMGRRPFTVVRSTITKETGLTVRESGFIDTAFLITYTLGQLGYEAIHRASRMSAHALLTLGLLGSGLAVMLQAFSSTSFGFTVGAALNGALQAVGWSSCMIVVTPWLGSSERGSIMGMWGTTMSAGGVFGNFITPLAMTATHSWRFGVAAVAACMLCTALFVSGALGRHPNAHGYLSPLQAERGLTDLSEHTRPTREGERDAPADAKSGEGRRRALGSREVLALPGVMGLSGSYFCAKLVRYVLMFWLPFYFAEVLHYGPAASGMIASALDFGGVAGTVLSGVFCDRYFHGRRRTEACLWLSLGLLTCLGCFALGGSLLQQFAPLAIVASLGCGAFSYGIDSVMTTTLVQDCVDRCGVPHLLGAVSGLVGGLGTLGSILQGPLTVVFSGMSWPVLFALLQALTAISGVCLLNLWRMERRQAVSVAGEV